MHDHEQPCEMMCWIEQACSIRFVFSSSTMYSMHRYYFSSLSVFGYLPPAALHSFLLVRFRE